MLGVGAGATALVVAMERVFGGVGFSPFSDPRLARFPLVGVRILLFL